MGGYKGEFTRRVCDHFDDVKVIEGASDLIAQARCDVQKPRARFPHGYFEGIELDEEFDAIFLVHALEHLDKPVHVLKRVNPWLTQNGKLFLVVPKANAPSRQIAVKMGLISHNAAVTMEEAAHGHRCTHSLDTLERDARSAGLSVLQHRGFYFKPFAYFQFDKLLVADIIGRDFFDGCYQLGMSHPDLCASIYLICR